MCWPQWVDVGVCHLGFFHLVLVANRWLPLKIVKCPISKSLGLNYSLPTLSRGKQFGERNF